MGDVREVTSHHDGHGLNENIRIEAGQLGPGGASHEYHCWVTDPDGTDDERLQGYPVAQIRFQCGPRNVEGSAPGVTTSTLLAIVKDHIEGFQAGEFACAENEQALFHIERAMAWIKQRADDRAKRGVLGTLAR